MHKFRDLHKGQTALIIGNGPSLKSVPRALLEKYISFGANSITLAYDQPGDSPKNIAGFVANYFVCINPLVLEQNKEAIAAYPALAHFLRAGTDLAGEKIYPLRSLYYAHFAYSPDVGVYEGFTVSFVSLQLAYFMGFSKVYLVGCDHKYSYEGGPNEQNNKPDPKANHFHKDYFKGQEWNNPDLDRSAEAYRLADEAYISSDRSVINLTPDSGLDVFEKGEYKDAY